MRVEDGEEMELDRIISISNTKTVYRSGDSCVKVFGKQFVKSDVLNEALNQARVEETGLNIPKIKEVTKVDDKWAIISQFIKGDTLERLITVHPEKVDEYLNLFVDLQASYQSKTCPLLSNTKDKLIAKIKKSDLSATEKCGFYRKLEDMPYGEAICHGDYNLSNVIIDDSGEAFIIDWSHVTSGNAEIETARTYVLFKLSDTLDYSEKYLEIYLSKNGVEREKITRFVPVVAAAQLYTANERERVILKKLLRGEIK